MSLALTKPRLIPNWRVTLRCAWSVRWMAIAAVFSGAEAAMPLLRNDGVPPGLLAALSGLAAVGGLVSRFILQRSQP